METIIYQVELNDGAIFNIFCANKAQKNRAIKTFKKMDIKLITPTVNGIHTIKEWEQIVTNYKLRNE